MKSTFYIIVGLFFGVVLYKSEAASWFRIYEMFQFDSFHMYGIIGSTITLGTLGIQWIKRKEVKAVDGSPIVIASKDKGIARYLIGGTLFGLGWALAGACPGPMFVLAGAGSGYILVVIASAILGTFFYGILRNKLPH
ncbi:DUF6691 family protein [Aureicoccus marinus]|uniref:Transporter n=1 Tax=Aureicoccus marinus TaxID=754435 RepID=A0A2S7T8Z7_9FLAO|nr:DUF6691 family protein [Aureicoccus marinus]PQJ15987.1 transporter [Aureicoccus marinus]